MKRRYVLALFTAIGILTIGSAGQDAPRPKVRPIQHIKDNLYWIPGGEVGDRTWTGGNTGVFITDQGVVLIDTMLPRNGQGILDQVRTVTDKPVTTIIHTHTHGDHTGSDAEFPVTVEFIAHENTKTNMAAMPAFQGDKSQFLPKKTFKDKMSLFSGKDRIDLYYFGNGHTNGDAWVVFPALRVMQTGDIFSRKAMPTCDLTNHGDPLENYQSLMNALNGVKNVETIIGGHQQTLLTWNDFKEYTEFYKEFLGEVTDGMKAGKTADEVASAYKSPEKYKDYVIDPARVKANVQGIFAALKK